MTKVFDDRCGWTFVQWLLLAVWVGAAALDMAHRHVAFLTTHAADLTLPAWLYLVSRRSHGRSVWMRALASCYPVVTAAVIFVASALTEISQYFRPHGLFPGRFDPLDLVAYGSGLALVCLADLRWPIPSRFRPARVENRQIEGD